MSDTQDSQLIELSPEAFKVADHIRKLSGLHAIADAICLALGDELYFRKKVQEGFNVLVSRDGEYRQVDLTPSWDVTPRD